MQKLLLLSVTITVCLFSCVERNTRVENSTYGSVVVLPESENQFQRFTSVSDTLHVPYTYWWPQGGPFIGNCGEPYAIVFTGTLVKLQEPLKQQNEKETLYIPQWGVIKIHEVFTKRQLQKGHTPQHYFKSDCFYGLPLKEGDKVMGFVYLYEENYSIPGNSILKVEGFNDAAVRSISRYIKNKENPLAIAADTTIWTRYGFDGALKQLIDCKSAGEIVK